MTKIASMTLPTPRGKNIGKQVSEPPLNEASTISNVRACGGWFDMRDLGAVPDHEERPCPIRHAIKCGSVAG
jgi:hypothetical protein